jgi:hypothetical protein
VAHRLLEAFWRETGDHASLVALSPEALATRVRGFATQVLDPLRGAADDVRLRLLDLEQRWLEDRVLELLQHDRAREPFTVVGVETERVLDVGGVQVRVVLDRLDRLADGSYALIDYKTGASAQPRAWMGERPELPQLPLYVRTVAQHEVSAVAFAVVRKGATGYQGFAREAGLFSALQTFDARKKPFKEFVDWPALIRTWQRRLDTLGEEHARGDARLAPDPARACRFCHLPGLCRSAQALLDVTEDDDDDDADA